MGILGSLAVRVALRTSLSLLLLGEMLLTFVEVGGVVRLLPGFLVSVLQKVIVLLPVILGKLLTLPLLEILLSTRLVESLFFSLGLLSPLRPLISLLSLLLFLLLILVSPLSGPVHLFLFSILFEKVREVFFGELLPIFPCMLAVRRSRVQLLTTL